MKFKVLLITGLMLEVLAGQVHAGIVVHTTDFISNENRTHFNGFESIENNGVFYTGSGPYTHDSIQVEQVNPSGYGIWVTANFWSGFEGAFAWYPNAGDHGYSLISLVGGGDFDSVGFNIGTGFSAVVAFLYELLDDNIVVSSGSVSGTSSYLGFSGGGFDSIRIRDSRTGGGSVTDHTYQAVAFDNIETFSSALPPTNISNVPEPASIAMFGIGALGLMFARRRRSRTAWISSRS